MAKNYRRILPVVCLCLLLTVGGCYLPIAKYERTLELSSPLVEGSLFAAQTPNGSITVNGAGVTDCSLTATIVARAVTEEEAQKLAERTKITLEPSPGRLTAKIEKPILVSNQSIAVNLDVTVPNRTNLESSTHNGAIKVTNITGQVSGATHNGSIRCDDISGDAQLKTHNGSVKVRYSQAAPPACDISIVTYNGQIEFAGPANLSAAVEASTHNGSITTELPVTVVGNVSKRSIFGTIGAGQGKVHLETHNGSITIR
jgi:DUF4097 and DUF4098 domain-containing protein YvlB